MYEKNITEPNQTLTYWDIKNPNKLKILLSELKRKSWKSLGKLQSQNYKDINRLFWNSIKSIRKIEKSINGLKDLNYVLRMKKKDIILN